MLKKPRSVMAVNTIAVRPAAGPETLRWLALSEPITIPPTIPAIIPANKGALQACAIPRHNGRAIRNTISPEKKSFFKCLVNGVVDIPEVFW
jgi:hypothetical protein